MKKQYGDMNLECSQLHNRIFFSSEHNKGSNTSVIIHIYVKKKKKTGHQAVYEALKRKKYGVNMNLLVCKNENNSTP